MKKWIQSKDLKVKRGDLVLEIGEYIDYHDHAGKKGRDIYKGKWQILGADEMGRLLIISEDNVAKYCFNEENTLEGAKKAYVNGIDDLDSVCEKFANGENGVKARSVRIEDIDVLANYDKTQKMIKQKKIYHNKEGNDFIWYDGTKWNCTNSEEIVEITKNYYYYYCYKHSLNLNPKVYNMLFGKNSEKKYWLASRYVNCNYVFNFGFRKVYRSYVDGIRLVDSKSNFTTATEGVRAVVILNEDIKLTPKYVISKYEIG